MRRVVRESIAALALGLILPFLGCQGTASRLPEPSTTTTSIPGARALDGHTAPQAAACTIGGYRVVTDPISARHLGRCYTAP